MARHQLAVISLAVVALVSSFWLLLDVVNGYSNRAQTFGVDSFEDRFRELRKTLAPHSVVGYTSDNLDNDVAAQAEYYLTQYTLAPTIVDSTPNEPLVVVNFHNPQPDLAKLQAQHLTLVRDFGSGVLLCRNNTR